MPVSASTFNVPLEALADRTAWLRARTPGAAGSYHAPVPLVSVRSVNFSFTPVGGPGSNAYGYVQGGTPASTDGITVPLSVPGIGTPTSTPKLTSVKISVRPANGHSDLPTTKWGAALIRQGAGAGAAVILAGPTLDNPADVTAYQALREITLTANAAITTSDEYYVIITGEGGSNALAGLLVTRIGVTVDPE